MPLPEVTGRLCIIPHIAGLPQTSSLLSYIRSINILPFELRRYEHKHFFLIIILFFATILKPVQSQVVVVMPR